MGCQLAAMAPQNNMILGTICMVMFGHRTEVAEWIPGVDSVNSTKQQTSISFSVQFEFRMPTQDAAWEVTRDMRHQRLHFMSGTKEQEAEKGVNIVKEMGIREEATSGFWLHSVIVKSLLSDSCNCPEGTIWSLALAVHGTHFPWSGPGFPNCGATNISGIVSNNLQF